MTQDYLAPYATVDDTCEWLKAQIGSKWTLARILENGLKPWFMLSREPHQNDPIHDELFGSGEAVYPTQILSERDIRNLAIDGREAIVRKISTHDGREVDVGPVGLWRVPVHEIRFRSKDIQELVARYGTSTPSPKPSPSPAATARRVKPNGGDALTPFVWEICYDLRDANEKVTPGSVIRVLKIRAQSPDPRVREPLISSTAGGVKFETIDGDEKELTRTMLAARINEWKKAQS